MRNVHAVTFVLLASLAPSARAEQKPDAAQADDPASAPAIFHTPVASAPADQPLAIEAEVRASHRFAEIRLYYRPAGAIDWRWVPFQRATGGGFTATIPPSETAAGTLEYYIAARTTDGAAEELHFASPNAPHVVALLGDNEARWKRELLAQQYGNRSRFQLRGEYVNFGSRTDKDGNTVPDDYWHGELDYTYRILGWIYSIRAGGGYMAGRSYSKNEVGDPIACGDMNPQCKDVGLKYGFSELRFRLGALVRLDLRLVLGAGPTHFDGGGGAMILIGNEPGTHFDLGFEYVSEVGGRVYLRLAWNTVRAFPMSFNLEGTSWPNTNDVSGRAYFSVEHRFGRHFAVEATGGYAARTWRIGGPSGGLGMRFEF